jgi:hypothetical protein
VALISDKSTWGKGTIIKAVYFWLVIQRSFSGSVVFLASSDKLGFLFVHFFFDRQNERFKKNF